MLARTPRSNHDLSSAPTILVAGSALLFYSQLAFGWWAPTSWTATAAALLAAFVLAASLALGVALVGLHCARAIESCRGHSRKAATAAAVVLGLLLALTAYLDLKPAHAPQEAELVNGLALLRQHWLAASWKPLEWSTAEFRLPTLSYALSFFWVALPLLSRLPQLVLLLFLLARAFTFFELATEGRRTPAGLCFALALAAFLAVAGPLGLAGLDVPALYFLAGLANFVALDARSGKQRPPLAPLLILGVDLALYCGQLGLGVVLLALLLTGLSLLSKPLLGRRLLARLDFGECTWLALPVVILHVPRLLRAYIFTGDPFFPLFPSLVSALCDPTHLSFTTCEQLAAAAASTGGAPATETFTWLILGAAFVPVLFCAFRARGSFRRAARTVLALSALLLLPWLVDRFDARWLLAPAALWGYVLGTRLGERGTDRPALTGLAALILLAAVGGGRAVNAQRATLGCLGAECLKSHTAYWSDFNTSCGNETVTLEDTAGRGYFPCRFTAPATPATIPERRTPDAAH